MDHAVLHAMLQSQKLAYVLADRDLHVIEVDGLAGVAGALFPFMPGGSLYDGAPELVGCEGLIADLLSGLRPQLAIEHINRQLSSGAVGYFTLTLLPYRGQHRRARLLLLIADSTEQGGLLQQHAQSRNELRLLSDVLARRNAELEHANAELKRLSDMRSNFVAVAAHELRNPLTPILGYLELLLDEDCGPLNENQTEALQVVLKNVLRLRTITADLLDLARIEAGRIDLSLQPVELRALVEMVCHEYQPQLASKQQVLELQVDQPLPDAFCDETRAAQIVGNLLSNASKYTPRKGRISVRVQQGEGGFLQIVVADTGMGIAPEDQPSLFDAFFRARAAAANASAGTGLGLHITRLLVELQGGRVWFTSVPGQGSTFFVTLPAALEESDWAARSRLRLPSPDLR